MKKSYTFISTFSTNGEISSHVLTKSWGNYNKYSLKMEELSNKLNYRIRINKI